MTKRVRAAGDTAAGEKKAVVEDVEDILNVARDATDQIWFWRRRGDRFAYLEKRPAEALRELGIRESARQRYGGGEFRARLRTNNQQWGASRLFDIEGEPKALESNTPAVHASAPAPGTNHELPSWIEKIVVPAAVALVAGITNKLLSDPKTDPIALELLKRAGGGVDPLELQRLLMDAENRGEKRGREIGELAGAGDRVVDAAGAGGVVDAIREAAPLVERFLDRADEERRDRRDRGAGDTSTEATMTRRIPSSTDIVPVWLRPFMSFKRFVINAADADHDPEPMAGMVITNADDATWAAIVEAEAAGRLESDLYAAMPELASTSPLRDKFATGLLKHIRVAIARHVKDAAKNAAHDGDAANAAKPVKGAKKATSGTRA